SAAQEVPRQLPLRLDQGVDLILDRAAAYKLVHQHILALSDAERTVGRLVFNSGIPPAIEMDDVRGGGQVEPGSPGLERKHEERHILVLLKPAHQVLAFAHFSLAM